MDELNKPIFGPQIEEPTDEMIAQTIVDVQRKYGVTLSREESVRFAKLSQELGWWLTVEKHLNPAENVTESLAQEIQLYAREYHGRDVSLEQVTKETENALKESLPREKERIATEIRSIIAQHKQN